MTDTLKDARILVIDDEPANQAALKRMLQGDGYDNVVTAGDASTGWAELCASPPDVVLLDLRMPGMDGFDFLNRLGEESDRDDYLPVMVLTGDGDNETKRRALASGAHDFLSKPFDREEVKLRTSRLLENRLLHKRLEFLVELRTQEVVASRQAVLDRLALAAEFRDDDTAEHTRRVGHNTAAVARALDLPKWHVEDLLRAAPLHDLGKIGIPDAILLKPGRLEPQEFEVIKAHCQIGAEILGESTYRLLEVARDIALGHHERFDGSGYPSGLSGTAIPLAARIVAVTDVYDALTHKRVYKEAWTVERALDEVRAQAGHHFDPHVVEAFLSEVAESRILV